MELDERRDAWIRRRAEWWAHRRLGKSSEDVWEMRAYDDLFILLSDLSIILNREPPKDFPRVISLSERDAIASTTVV